MQAVLNDIFKKKPKLKSINLYQIVDVYKICKPFLGEDFEPYLLAEKVYTVSTQKIEKLYRIFYGTPCPFLSDPTASCMAISFGFTHNHFEDFVRLIKRK